MKPVGLGGTMRYRGVFAGVALLLMVSATGCGTGNAPGGSPKVVQSYRPDGSATMISGQTETIQIGDMFFRPNTLQASDGASITLPGERQSDSFQVPPSGVYYFYCAVPGHAAAGMVGRLVVA